MFDLTSIVEIIGLLIATIITSILVPFIRSKTTAEQQQNINAWVQIAVTAAEQIFNGSGRGAEKKEYVIGFLAEKGIKIEQSSIDAMIESAVEALNKGLI